MKITRSIAVAGASMLLLASAPVMASAADAIPCGTPAKDAVYEIRVTPAIPPVYGPDVKVIDVPAQDAVPAKPGTPAIPAVYEEVKIIDQAYVPATPGTPAVEEVSHIEHRLVTPAVPGKDAYDEVITPSEWWNWSPNHTHGPQDYVPNFPADERGTWQGPHTNGGPDGEGTFNVSHGNSGNSSWFHREPAVVIHHDAIPEIPAVYEDVKVIDVEAKPAVPGTPEIPEISHTETVLVSPAVPEVPATPAIPAVEEVSHMEKGELLEPASPEFTEEILVSKATPAGEPCPIPVVKTPSKTPTKLAAPPASPTPDRSELAMTGSDLLLPTGLGALLILAGVGGMVAAHRVKD